MLVHPAKMAAPQRSDTKQIRLMTASIWLG